MELRTIYGIYYNGGTHLDGLAGTRYQAEKEENFFMNIDFSMLWI